jgi:integrase
MAGFFLSLGRKYTGATMPQIRDLLPVVDYFSYVLESYQCHHPKSRYRMRKCLIDFAEQWSSLKVHDICPAHVEAFCQDHPTWGQSTIKKTKELLKQAFKWGVDRRILTRNPLADLKGGSEPIKPKGVEALVTEDEYNALLSVAGREGKRMLEFLYRTGCRPGEMRRAQAIHYKPNLSALVMPDTKCSRNGKPKTRTIRISEALTPMIEDLVGKGRNFLFINPGDDFKPWEYGLLESWFKSLKKRANVDRPGLCLYSFRHSFCTEGLRAHLSVDEVAILAGNSPEIIRNNYSHLADLAQHHLSNLSKFR